MATYNDYTPITGLTAGVTLAAAQYKVVKFASTAGAVILVSATTDSAIGILQNDPTAGQPASIGGPGSLVKAIAGPADVAAGDLLGWDSTARVADHTTDGQWVIAQAMEPSTAANDIIRVLVHPLNGFS